MYGAILGDIVGRPYEFKRCRDIHFPLLSWRSRFSDDSVMTIAIAEALLKSGRDADIHEIEKECVRSMLKWGRRYPFAGYGKRFIKWLLFSGKHPKPYKSCGNGSAMRISTVGWLYDSLERTREVARATAVVSHNHPDGMNGAEAVAMAVFLARKGCSKQEIKTQLTTEFSYNLNRSCETIRATYCHKGKCAESVPEAIIAFLESCDYETAIRNAVYLGGDSDTLACIAGAIAEAYYGVADDTVRECRKRIRKPMIKVVDDFYTAIGK